MYRLGAAGSHRSGTNRIWNLTQFPCPDHQFEPPLSKRERCGTFRPRCSRPPRRCPSSPLPQRGRRPCSSPRRVSRSMRRLCSARVRNPRGHPFQVLRLKDLVGPVTRVKKKKKKRVDGGRSGFSFRLCRPAAGAAVNSRLWPVSSPGMAHGKECGRAGLFRELASQRPSLLTCCQNACCY